MVFDSGGLAYVVKIDDQASSQIQSLIAQINELRAAASSLGEGFSSLRQVSGDTKKNVESTKELATETRKSSRAAREAAGAYDLQAKGVRAAAREVESRLIAARKEIELEKIGIVSKKKEIEQRKQAAAAVKAEAQAVSANLQRNIAQIRTQEAQAKASAQAKAKSLQDEIDRGKALRQVRAAQEQAAAADLAEDKKIIASRLQVSDLEKRLAAQRERAAKEQAAAAKTQEKARAALPESKAAAIEERTLSRIAILQALLKRGILPKGELEKARNELAKLNGELSTTQSTGNRISFTFRRLFGILAAFAIARKIIQSFTTLIRESIAFNAQIEQSSLAIASLVVATGDVRDAVGRTVDPARAFVLAQKEARKQMILLRVDALRTAATFDDLAFAFQTAVAPGQQVGFNLDQIRKFAVQISQAATAIGLPQQQLAEEIRSLLQGTIQPRTTRIAAALGITNEDIRRAREAGTLADFLNKRFQAFSKAAEAGSNNLSVIVSRLKNVALLIGGAASSKLFEALKVDLKDILDGLVEIGEEGKEPIINPKAVAAVRGIFDGLNEALEVARGLKQELNLRDVEGVARAIGASFKAAAQIIAPIIKGIVKGIGDAASFLTPLIQFLGSDAGKLFGNLLGEVIRLLTVLTIIRGVVGGISKGVLFLFNVFSNTGREIVSAANATIEWGRAIAAAETRAIAFGRVLNGVKLAATQIGAALVTFGTIELFSRGNETARKVAKDLGVNLDDMQVTFWEDFQLSGFGAAKNIAEFLGEQLPSGLVGFFGLLGVGIKAEQQEIVRGSERIIARLADQVAARQKKLATQTERVSLADAFDELLPVIGRVRVGLEAQGTIVRDLREEFKEVELIKRRTLANVRLEGAAQQIVEIATDAEVRNLRESEALLREKAESQQRIKAFQEEQVGLQNRLARLDPRAIDATKELEAQLRAQIETEDKLAEAQKRGDKEEEARLQALSKNRRAALETALPADLAKNAREIIDIALGRIRTEAQVTVELGKQREIEDDLTTLQKAILAITRERIEAVAARETEELRKQNRELALRIVQEDRVRRARLSSLETLSDAPLREQLANQINITQELVEQKRLSQETFQANLRALEEQRNILVNTQQPIDELGRIRHTEDLLKIEGLISAERQKQALVEEGINAKLQESIELAQRLQKAATSIADAFDLGFSVAFAKFRAEAPDALQTAFQVGTQALEGFVQIGREAFASIFDPNSNFSIKEALGRLLLQIADTLINSSLRNLLSQIIGGADVTIPLTVGASEASAILILAGKAVESSMVTGALSAAAILKGASFASTGSFIGPPAPTGHFGGEVNRNRIGQNPPVYRAIGGVAGHPGRPRGRDRIPAWLEEREWVIRARSAQMYGDQTMEAINRGLIDPTMLRGLAAATRVGKPPTVPATSQPIHRASGGAVPRGIADGREVVPVLVTGERSFEQMLNSGSGAMERWLADRGFVRN